MKSKTVQVTGGTTIDAFGMPSIYWQYLVVGITSDGKEAIPGFGVTNPGWGIAKIYRLTPKAPEPNEYYAHAEGGADAAIDLGVQQLKDQHAATPGPGGVALSVRVST